MRPTAHESCFRCKHELRNDDSATSAAARSTSPRTNEGIEHVIIRPIQEGRFPGVREAKRLSAAVEPTEYAELVSVTRGTMSATLTRTSNSTIRLEEHR